MKTNIIKERMTFAEVSAMLKEEKGRLLNYSEINELAKTDKEVLQILKDDWVWISDTDLKGRPLVADVGCVRGRVGVGSDVGGGGHARVVWVKP